ncbi:MAG: 16S rRNA (adenine(1518)-N(6)/adenine(1519)-N(6))-dimethyltransferase [Arachnia propionica]|nr:MAG: 16S rRNA (adenine(1518)-N(6)/adenine(1519)-N(6))-dimethyltransferase [Arachnia propionica]
MAEAGLLGAQQVRQLAAELGLRPSKQRGQNFVIDPNTIERIVSLADVHAGDTVVEVGPGLGSLTLGLLQTGASVTAIEIDPRLAGRLGETVADRLGAAARQRLTIIEEDALAVTSLPGQPPALLVANLPYNVSVPVVLHLLERFETLRGGLVLVQLEVAQRLAAGPGSRVYGAPSVKLAWYAEATQVGTVSPAVFWPVPNVDSGLVRLTRREPPATTASRQQVFRLVDAAFAQRRKMLRAALAPVLGPSSAEIIQAAGIDPTSRGERLQVTDFAAIAEAWASS